MIFICEWLIFYVAILFAMCVDNLFWIGASPEYKEFKKYNLEDKLNYIFRYRIWTVLTHWRDITPAIITSFILALTINL